MSDEERLERMDKDLDGFINGLEKKQPEDAARMPNPKKRWLSFYDSDNNAKKVVKTTTVKDNGNKSEQTEDSNKETSSSEERGKRDSNGVQNGDTKLPDNLPPELLANVKRFTEASKVSSSEKSNFFDSTNMNLLFEIDTAARLKGGVVLNQVYNYLETYLPCTKQTIMMRANEIRNQKEEAKTKTFVIKLKMAVGNMMPDMLVSKSVQPIKQQKKKFLWTDLTRNLLCEIINSRKQSYAVIKPRRESVEDFVRRYLKEHVVKIWPDGWMKVDELLKEFDKRQVNHVKKSKESKESSAQPVGKANTSTTLSSSTAVSDVANSHSSLLISEVKSLMSSNNSILPNLKETLVTAPKATKSNDTNSSTDATKATSSPPTPTFGQILNAIGVNAGVQNQKKQKQIVAKKRTPGGMVRNQVYKSNVTNSSTDATKATPSPPTPTFGRILNAKMSVEPLASVQNQVRGSNATRARNQRRTQNKRKKKIGAAVQVAIQPMDSREFHFLNGCFVSTK